MLQKLESHAVGVTRNLVSQVHPSPTGANRTSSQGGPWLSRMLLWVLLAGPVAVLHSLAIGRSFTLCCMPFVREDPEASMCRMALPLYRFVPVVEASKPGCLCDSVLKRETPKSFVCCAYTGACCVGAGRVPQACSCHVI